MTTSFSWFARGNFVASFYIQPMGTVLAVLAVGAFWLGLYEAATGRAAHRLIARVPSRYYVTPLLAWAVIAWAWKIFIHLHGIDGWHA
jgi:aminopeptidase N